MLGGVLLTVAWQAQAAVIAEGVASFTMYVAVLVRSRRSQGMRTGNTRSSTRRSMDGWRISPHGGCCQFSARTPLLASDTIYIILIKPKRECRERLLPKRAMDSLYERAAHRTARRGPARKLVRGRPPHSASSATATSHIRGRPLQEVCNLLRAASADANVATRRQAYALRRGVAGQTRRAPPRRSLLPPHEAQHRRTLAHKAHNARHTSSSSSSSALQLRKGITRAKRS